MVIIIFYSRIVPYKWLEDGAAADHPNEEPADPKFLLSSLYNAMFYSAVVLFLLLKKCSPAGKENCGKREWGIFVRRSVFILPYDLKLSFLKKDPEPHFFFPAVFDPNCFQTWCLPALPSHWTTHVGIGIGLGACTRTNTHTHTLARTHTRTHRQTLRQRSHQELNPGVAQPPFSPSEHACPPISTCGAKETCRK